MPDFWTHLVAGEEINAGLSNKSLQKLINNNYQLFNYGCQGADFFFYHNFLPWQQSEPSSKKGNDIHRLSAKKLFAEILTAYKKEGVYHHKIIPDSAYWQHNLVYLLGFISHFAVDRECHPYILEHGGRGKDHKQIEASIDLYIMKKKWQQSPVNTDPRPYYRLLPEIKDNLKFFYKIIFDNLIKEELNEKLLWDSYLDYRKYHKIFYTSGSKKYYLFKFINYIIPQNLAQYNYGLCENKAVWPEKNYLEFEKRYKKGVESAQKLIEKTLLYFSSEISLSELLKNYGDKNFMGE